MKASTQHRSSRAGSALLIILAFILLLSIIATAFLSKALLEKTVSNASSDQTRTDVFAAGAVDAILSDCQQEIGAGSKTATTTPAVYLPNTAKTIVPSRTGSGSSNSTMALVFSATPNLVKCSADGVNFYPTGDSTDFPNAAAFPPAEKSFATADPNDSTSVASLNGRAYPAVRWNQALLLPKKTPTSNTDYSPITGFTVPDWILVQRDGTNPTAWSTSLLIASPTDVTTTNKNPVVGRYAYTIYDEGGLLDMNVTGYPSLAGPSSSTQHFYRSSLASVDLMQLMPTSAGPAYFPSTGNLLKPGNPIIDSLVGWRNGATLQTSGALGAYSFNTATPLTYFQDVLPAGTGFLHATVPSSITTLAGGASNGQSDRKFSSRQQLIDLMLNGIAPAVVNAGYVQTLSVTQANMQNALQYMGTFSRDLSQPSYQPDANRPRMAPPLPTDPPNDPALRGANIAAADDFSNQINVAFPTTLVQAAFTRNDGSPANVGDPLVKRRFALNRLAWLTYAGPIATDAGVYTNATTTAIATTLKATYGFTDAFLLQGGPTNIQNYFGLSWAADTNDGSRSKWFYNVHNNSSGTGKGIIRELGGGSGIAASGDANAHDPDFFELLKATILAGSKGKTLLYKSGVPPTGAPAYPTDPLHPYNEQYASDISLDLQVLQIGANIIDQFDTDAYTTEIVFDNGNGPVEVRGVENFPYLYRLRAGTIKLRNERATYPAIAPFTRVAVPDDQYKDTAPASPLDSTANYTIVDTGVGAMMQVPELWNPHDVNAPMGSPYPVKFRIVAYSADPTTVATGGALSNLWVTGYDDVAQSNASSGGVTVNNPFSSSSVFPAASYTRARGGGTAITGGFAGQTGRTLNDKNTEMNFVVPTTAGSTAFREPTMLAMQTATNPISLQMNWTALDSYTADLEAMQNAAGTVSYAAGKGFLSDSSNPLLLPAASTPAATQHYMGIMLGIYPIEWTLKAGAINYIYDSHLATLHGSSYLTYRMQYQDPLDSTKWVTYDEKYINVNAPWTITALADKTAGTSTGNLLITGSNSFNQSGNWQSFMDPRTSRYGTPLGINDNTAGFAPAGVSSSTEYLDSTANVVLPSDRPDYNQGYAIETYRVNGPTVVSALNSYLAPGWVATAANGYSLFRWGPMSQNTKASFTTTGARFSGDANTVGANLPHYYADADGVVRRAMGGLVPNTNIDPTDTFGYPGSPMTTASVGYKYPDGTSVYSSQSKSRPYILNRPFRMVGELGYVFSGTPWKNLDFSNPESGDSPLLDVFCISDTDDPNGLVAGKVNLNTQQLPVLAAILSEAYYDDVAANGKAAGGYIGATDVSPNTGGSAYTTAGFSLAKILMNGPAGTTGTAVTPLMNVRELVGKYTGSSQTAGTMGIDGTTTYAGFGSDIGSFYTPSPAGAGASYTDAYTTRFREGAVRALSAVGQTRVWNLMIDVVAQTGRYPATATNAANFLVEGERRYWVHVAIDRYTGNILDRQIEEVRQ